MKPVAQPVRRMPFGHRKLAKAKLDELLESGIIERVEGPTPWVSPIVTVPKDDGDIRLCVDMRRANEAVVRERYPIPTVKELLYNLNGAKVFSKADLKLGFHQFELDEGSRNITTFTTPFGLFRYKRLMFGIASAPEVYQYQIQKAISGLEGCQNYADDIVIYGKDQNEHDNRLRAFLKRMQDLGLTLNPAKCQFGLKSISYVGYGVSSEGISVSPDKIDSVTKARVPKDVSELRSFLGLVNFVGKFIPNLPTVAEPLLRLIRHKVKFVWGEEQRKAFERIKELMSKCETLAFFDANATTCVTADASPYGLGCVLSQVIDGVDRVIAYGHRSLTNVERRYSQTEREALAIVWACEHFYMYLQGLKFTLITDHKPLQYIFNRVNSQPTPRLERWVLRLQAFNYDVVYRPGRTNIADPLSRLSADPNYNFKKKNVADSYVRMVMNEALPKAMSFSEIRLASIECPELRVVKTALIDGFWGKCLPGYKAVHTELSECEGVLLRGNRIVVPVALRKTVISLAHEGHQGIVKTKHLLRSKVWWPGMDSEVEKLCRGCFECQLVSSPSKPEPISSTRMPDGPWQHIACDLLGPLPNGQSILVIVDYYSRYFEVAFLRSTATNKVIEACETVFSRWGLPLSCRTDNGPQFGLEFQRFLQENGVRWLSTTPLWPQANGEVERQNRSLLKSLKIANLSGRDYQRELKKYLLAYRSTPHSSTGVSPAKLMLGRELRTKLPCLERDLQSVMNEGVCDRDSLYKLKQKELADGRRGAVLRDISVGDKVMLRAEPKDKLSPTFDPQPYEVVSRGGSEIVVRNEEGRQLRRNISEAKQLVSEGNLCKESNAHNEEIEVEARPTRNRYPPQRFGNPIEH